MTRARFALNWHFKSFEMGTTQTIEFSQYHDPFKQFLTCKFSVPVFSEQKVKLFSHELFIGICHCKNNEHPKPMPLKNSHKPNRTSFCDVTWLADSGSSIFSQWQNAVLQKLHPLQDQFGLFWVHFILILKFLNKLRSACACVCVDR